jgi:2-polyprenyl-3-methyl-5-hydroxy-6-metoxy-1,4-benzoquinol methylase
VGRLNRGQEVGEVEASGEAAPRPFYHRFAWAYDRIIADHVGAHAAFIAAALSRLGVPASATVLDAGCGTGRYAIELAHRGFRVLGIDRSPELIEQADKNARASGIRLPLAVGDLRALAECRRLDAVLCRGVLNDVLDDDDRDTILAGFAKVMRLGGVLILDVRDWQASARRHAGGTRFERVVPLADGSLRFQSRITPASTRQRLLVHERFTLYRDGTTTRFDQDFTMRCWSHAELDARLPAAGFGSTSYRTGYGNQAWNDRIVAITRRVASA